MIALVAAVFLLEHYRTSVSLSVYGVGLEGNAQPELSVARAIGLPGDSSEGGSARTAEVQAGIGRLEVIQDIGELNRKSEINPLGKSEVFANRSVQVPSSQAAEVAVAPTATSIEAQNAWPEISVYLRGVGEGA